MRGEVFGEVGVGLGLDDGEVVPINDVRADAAGGLDKIAEVFAQLRCAAGDVHNLRAVLLDPCADFFGVGFGDHFSAPRRGVHVAVAAGLVALAPDVDLQGAEFSPA